MIMNMSGDFRYVRKKYIRIATPMGKSYDALYKPGTELRPAHQKMLWK